MSYLDVLPLSDVKTYLRIDDTQSETDSEITSMIKSSLSYIEKHTNIILFARDKDYYAAKGCVRVYDYPINTLESDLFSVDKKTSYSNYMLKSSAETLTLNVGYDDSSNVPTDLIDLAKVMIKVMFYEQESNQSFKDMLPAWAKEILNSNKRRIV